MSRPRTLLASLLGFLFVSGVACGPTARADAPKILFLRGADRSGGFTEARDDAGRTRQLSSIHDKSTAMSNTGWYQLAQLLRGAGFAVTEIAEPVEDGNTAGRTRGRPVPLETMKLEQYAVIVFGSNNARYGKAAADAVEKYVRAGGGVIFISDANWGSDWSDASLSDQPFLDRFGLIMNQDQGRYVVDRTRRGHVQAPDHPVLKDVRDFDGEGVTPITVRPASELPAGVKVTILARAQGWIARNTEPFGRDRRGPSTAAEERDAALLVATVGKGRVVCHFDRNTFFNTRGAGTWLTRHDNEQLARNIFTWVAGANAPKPD